jgi:hypothetical protein
MKSFNNNLLLKTTKYILWNVRMHMSHQIKHVNRLIAANPVSHINMREFYMQTIHTLACLVFKSVALSFLVALKSLSSIDVFS